MTEATILTIATIVLLAIAAVFMIDTIRMGRRGRHVNVMTDRALDHDEWSAATRRWTAINNRKPIRCECGAPGTRQVFSPYGYIGDVAPMWWRCDEHANVPLTVPWHDGVPQIGLSRDACSWRNGSTITRTVSACGCGTHVGEPM